MGLCLPLLFFMSHDGHNANGRGLGSLRRLGISAPEIMRRCWNPYHDVLRLDSASARLFRVWMTRNSLNFCQ